MKTYLQSAIEETVYSKGQRDQKKWVGVKKLHFSPVLLRKEKKKSESAPSLGSRTLCQSRKQRVTLSRPHGNVQTVTDYPPFHSIVLFL